MKKGILAVTVILIAALTFTSCAVEKAPAKSPDLIASNSEESSNMSGAVLYKNETFGLSLEFPAGWKDKYIVADEGDSLIIYSKNTLEADKHGDGGELFRISRQIGELITKEEIESFYFKGRIISQGGGYTYVSSIGNGYNGPTRDQKQLYDEYIEMFGKRDEICNTAKLLGTNNPKASNPGYRVVGSSFFTAEIPADWEVRASPDSIIRWDISKDGANIGTIEMIPCYSEKITSDFKNMREYVLDSSKQKTADARITLSADKVDKETMDKIRGSFKIVPNFNTVVVLQSKANKYASQGGNKIFGRFDGFNKVNGLNVSINIRLMRYVLDSSAKGYHIEDLKQTMSYPIASMVDVVSPVGPDYKNYRSYDSNIIDAGTKNDLNKDTYYDFIIYDGKVEMIMGRYLP